jgi:hypothetical protein
MQGCKDIIFLRIIMRQYCVWLFWDEGLHLGFNLIIKEYLFILIKDFNEGGVGRVCRANLGEPLFDNLVPFCSNALNL